MKPPTRKLIVIRTTDLPRCLPSNAALKIEFNEHRHGTGPKGAARLQFEDGMVEMKPGDFVNIPAFKKHRVDWTTPDEPTVWLGVRYGGQG